MRAFSACLSVFLGLGICYISACSSDSTTGGGTAGDAGETSTAGSSGKAGSSGAGAAGAPVGAAGESAAGAAGTTGSTCAFDSPACTSCLQTKCKTELGACANATDCAKALTGLEPCACGGDMTALMCETTFLGDGGTLAQPLVDCFNTNCAASCM